MNEKSAWSGGKDMGFCVKRERVLGKMWISLAGCFTVTVLDHLAGQGCAGALMMCVGLSRCTEILETTLLSLQHSRWWWFQKMYSSLCAFKKTEKRREDLGKMWDCLGKPIWFVGKVDWSGSGLTPSAGQCWHSPKLQRNNKFADIHRIVAAKSSSGRLILSGGLKPNALCFYVQQFSKFLHHGHSYSIGLFEIFQGTERRIECHRLPVCSPRDCMQHKVSLKEILSRWCTQQKYLNVLLLLNFIPNMRSLSHCRSSFEAFSTLCNQTNNKHW